MTTTCAAGSLRARIAEFTALLARIAVGVVFAAHGWQKIDDGVAGTAEFFGAVGVPAPEVAAVVAMVVEFGGGVALAVGFALPVTGTLLAAMMAGAYVFAHLGDPLYDPAGGSSFELPLVLGATALALGFLGGRLTVDRFFPWGRVSPVSHQAAVDAR
ncbi:DoxX family protein [Lipingzhangella sp. LS1_29]|uniref:DoxX family protein n=1 Tax=Lipingzhangella rawalii TaxID=2055835 RepID=A0ABU2H6E3_9ACTN|nr:DoxX family protein [Lipingzhangella rawalii]MDS1270868.1 DoxX family protein [Lipingzhangella rawalii]